MIINDRIKDSEVRLIGHDGEQIGVVSREKALDAVFAFVEEASIAGK